MRRFVRSIREGSAPAIHKSSSFVIAAMVLAASGAASCAAEQVGPIPCPKVEAAPVVSGAAKPELPADPAATVEEARAFFATVDTDLRRLWTASSRADWVSQNFITDDTEALSAAGTEASMEYLTRQIKASTRFNGLKLPEDLSRQLLLLKLGSTLPAPSDPKERAELADISAWMTGAYGKGKYCPERLKNDPKKKCLTLGDLSNIMSKSRKYDELLDAWKG